MIDRHCQYPHTGAASVLLLSLLAGCASQPASQDQAAGEGSTQEPAQESTQEQDKKEKVDKKVVKPSHPVRYTVKRGDTLWDIAERFLRDPWVWPEIWSVNPQIDNPHLIYPGDVIRLAYVDGEPRLRVRRPERETSVDEDGDDVVKLSPEVREQPLDEAIPSIPASAIRQFLNDPRVVTQEQIETAPYILGNYEGRLISATGNNLFARGFENDTPDADRYSVFRPGEPLTDPQTGETLGFETLKVGEAAVRAVGPPVKLQLTNTSREVLKGDRLMPAMSQPAKTEYIPKVPKPDLQGQIIKLFDAVSQVGQNQVVVLNLGKRDDMEIGHVLQIEQSGGTATDPFAEENEVETVQLPRQRVGTLMIFKVFDKVSYGLTLTATQAIGLHDFVRPPE